MRAAACEARRHARQRAPARAALLPPSRRLTIPAQAEAPSGMAEARIASSPCLRPHLASAAAAITCDSMPPSLTPRTIRK
eukprot:scaffold11085_cov105-Isochrysis_galbana.AAC.4